MNLYRQIPKLIGIGSLKKDAANEVVLSMNLQKRIPSKQFSQLKVSSAVVLLVLIVTVGLAGLALANSSHAAPALYGEMKPGPYDVGFRVIHLKDQTRLVRPKRDYLGTVDTTDRARQIDLHVWYPAAQAGDAPMTFEQYIYYADFGAPSEATRRQQKEFARRNLFVERFSDDVWQRLLDAPMLAHRDAREAAGKFPLVLGVLRPLSSCITTEYLASHGYVVVMVEGDRMPSGLPREDPYRDLEFAYAHTRTMTNVDQNIVGTLGYSAFGTAQILYAMRTREVDAVVSLESAFFMDLF